MIQCQACDSVFIVLIPFYRSNGTHLWLFSIEMNGIYLTICYTGLWSKVQGIVDDILLDKSIRQN